jgi:hypothetical protein
MDARPEKKPDTEKDAQQKMLALLDRLKTFAEKAVTADAERQWDLAISEVLLRAAVVTEMQMNPGGVERLHWALLAAFHIGGFAAKDPALRAEVEKELKKRYKTQTAPATKGKQKKSAKAADLARQLRDEGWDPKLIPEEMAKRGMKRCPASTYAYLKQDDD